MTVTKGVHTDAAEEVEVALPFRVVQVDAVTALELHGEAVVRGEQEFALQLLSLF
jgi:hypothetical protein